VEDFAQRTHPVSSDWPRLAWVTGGAAGKDCNASFLREARFFALLCFALLCFDSAITLAGDLDCKGGERVAGMTLFC
jgi:hypothetical protein